MMSRLVLTVLGVGAFVATSVTSQGYYPPQAPLPPPLPPQQLMPGPVNPHLPPPHISQQQNDYSQQQFLPDPQLLPPPQFPPLPGNPQQQHNPPFPQQPLFPQQQPSPAFPQQQPPNPPFPQQQLNPPFPQQQLPPNHASAMGAAGYTGMQDINYQSQLPGYMPYQENAPPMGNQNQAMIPPFSIISATYSKKKKAMFPINATEATTEALTD